VEFEGRSPSRFAGWGCEGRAAALPHEAQEGGVWGGGRRRGSPPHHKKYVHVHGAASGKQTVGGKQILIIYMTHGKSKLTPLNVAYETCSPDSSTPILTVGWSSKIWLDLSNGTLAILTTLYLYSHFYFVCVKGFGLDGTPRKLYFNWGGCRHPRPPRIKLGGLPPPQTPLHFPVGRAAVLPPRPPHPRVMRGFAPQTALH
jgi:hypothetical protein